MSEEVSPHSGIGMTSLRTRQRLIARLREAGIGNEAVLEVMLQTPRHLFVDEALASRAYEDTALPIGYGQTISQPYIVARMTAALLEGRSAPPQRVLEIGTGSAYQTAVLSALVREVYTIERIAKLQERARLLLRELGVHNVRLKCADGAKGWQRYAPFDGVLLTAAPEEIPPVLLEQLALGGRLVAPVGGSRGQRLVVVERKAAGYERRELESVIFVPLLGGVL